MLNSYSAFGLALASGFPLPGMEPYGGEELPAVELSLTSAVELDAAWSGGRARNPWRGRLGDGEDLTIEWGHAGDLLFSYSDRARFRLDRERLELECAPADPAALEWQRVLLSRVLPGVGLARGYEALHAGAVATAAGVVAVAAVSGMGKSTLVRELTRRGGTLFSDDVVMLEGRSGAVLAHPGSPHTNLAEQGDDADELGTVLATLAGERWVAARRVARRPHRLAAIVLLERGAGLRLAAEPLPSNPLGMAPFMLGLPDEEPERQLSRFALYSDLVESAPLLRLSASPDDPPAALAAVLEEALAVDAGRAVSGAA